MSLADIESLVHDHIFSFIIIIIIIIMYCYCYFHLSQCWMIEF